MKKTNVENDRECVERSKVEHSELQVVGITKIMAPNMRGVIPSTMTKSILRTVESKTKKKHDKKLMTKLEATMDKIR